MGLLVSSTNYQCGSSASETRRRICRPTRVRWRPVDRRQLRTHGTIRGELAIWRRSSRHNLVFGGSIGIRTMMQPCASAAKLRGGGPILRNGFEGQGGIRVTATSDRVKQSTTSRSSAAILVLRSLGSRAPRTHATRKVTPTGTSPVVTKRHSEINSFRANATINVLRTAPPGPSPARLPTSTYEKALTPKI